MRRFLQIVAVLTAFSAPAWAQQDRAEEHLLTCPDGNADCARGQTDFVKWHRLAWRGDYQGQRNVAFYFGRDNDGAVRRNPTLACAWRLVIAASGSLKLVDSDAANVRIDCAKLDPVQQQIATGQAETIAKTTRRRR